MVGHTMAMATPGADLTRVGLVSLLVRPFLSCEQMVWLFILLSGFALYWVRNHRLEQGLGRTTLGGLCPPSVVAHPSDLLCGARRRIRACCAAVADFWQTPSPSVRTYKPVTLDGLVSHLALMHTLNHEWAHQFNPPLWSIAFEVQLYVLFVRSCS